MNVNVENDFHSLYLIDINETPNIHRLKYYAVCNGSNMLETPAKNHQRAPGHIEYAIRKMLSIE